CPRAPLARSAMAGGVAPAASPTPPAASANRRGVNRGPAPPRRLPILSPEAGMARTPTLIALVSIHGLIRGHNLELGRNADTGGQAKYVVELAAELGQCTGVERVDLLTRLIDDPDYASDYAAPLE